MPRREPIVENDGVSRRAALRLGSGGVLALVIGTTAGWIDRRNHDAGTSATPNATPTTTLPTTESASTTTASPTTTVFVEGLGSIDGRIIVLGERVMSVTGEDDLDALLSRLPSTGDPDPLRRAAQRVSDDFRNGQTIVVDGWILAASEARAAAVVALLCREEAC